MNPTEKVKPRLTAESKFALLLLGSEFFVIVLFRFFDQPQIEIGICGCLAILMIAMYVTWSLHKQVWYWFVIALSTAAQIPFVLLVPWANHDLGGRGGLAGLVLGLDFIMVYGCIRLGQEAMSRKGKES